MFTRSTDFRGGNRARRGVAACIALAGLLCGMGTAHADYFTDNSQTYVDATGGDSGNTVNSTSLSHTDWIAASDSASDNLWTLLTAGVSPLAENGNIWEADGPESEPTVPQITTTITGLTPGGRYEVYVVYVGRFEDSEDWALRAAISGNTLAVWDGTGLTGTATGPFASAAPAVKQYEGDLGVAVADGSGTISVDVNQLASGSGDDRAWYDGVAFTELPEPASLSMLGVGGLLLIRRRCGR